SCVRRIRRRLHCHGARGARRCLMRNLSATVMALLAAGSWNGKVMSAFSENRRRILSLWLPRLPIDRIKRHLSGGARAEPISCGTPSYSSPHERSNLDLKISHDGSAATPSIVIIKENNALQIFSLD